MEKIKFAFIAVVALLCATTVTMLSSCGSDDDDVNSGTIEGVNEITIGQMNFFNTTNKDYHTISRVLTSDEEEYFQINLYNSKWHTDDHGDALIYFKISPADFKSGKDITKNMTWFHLHLPSTSDKYSFYVDGNDLIVKSGKAEITNLTTEYATVKFSKFTVTLSDGNHYPINGTATCKIQ